MIQCYLIWFLTFIVINVIWDIRSKRTPGFHLARFKSKMSVAGGSTTFTSGILIFASAIDPVTRSVVGSNPAALVLAAAASMFLSLPYLCPYSDESGTG